MSVILFSRATLFFNYILNGIICEVIKIAVYSSKCWDYMHIIRVICMYVQLINLNLCNIIYMLFFIAFFHACFIINFSSFYTVETYLKLFVHKGNSFV